MPRPTTGSIVYNRGLPHARVRFTGPDGRRRSLWRRLADERDAPAVLADLLSKISEPGWKLANSEQARARIGYVYIMQMDVPGQEQGPVKIGYSTNPRLRLESVQNAAPYPVKLLCFWQVEGFHEES